MPSRGIVLDSDDDDYSPDVGEGLAEPALKSVGIYGDELDRELEDTGARPASINEREITTSASGIELPAANVRLRSTIYQSDIEPLGGSTSVNMVKRRQTTVDVMNARDEVNRRVRRSKSSIDGPGVLQLDGELWDLKSRKRRKLSSKDVSTQETELEGQALSHEVIPMPAHVSSATRDHSRSIGSTLPFSTNEQHRRLTERPELPEISGILPSSHGTFSVSSDRAESGEHQDSTQRSQTQKQDESLQAVPVDEHFISSSAIYEVARGALDAILEPCTLSLSGRGDQQSDPASKANTTHSTQDELAASPELAAHLAQQKITRAKTKRKNSSKQVEVELGSKSGTIGSLSEQYKSRGISPDSNLDRVDTCQNQNPSARKEKKCKIDRRKTTGNVIIHVDSGDEKEPVFYKVSPSDQQERAKIAPDPKSQEFAALAGIREQAERKEMVEAAPKKKRGRPKKSQSKPEPDQSQAVEEGHTKNEAIEHTILPDQVTALSKRGQARRKSKREPTLQPVEDSDGEGEAIVIEDDIAVLASNELATSLKQPADDCARPKTLTDKTSSTNIPAKQPVTTNTDGDTKIPNAPPPELSLAVDADIKFDAPQTPKRCDHPADVQEKGPTKHSPIGRSGKAPYRVGLSRKQRIQPLLQFVRK